MASWVWRWRCGPVELMSCQAFCRRLNRGAARSALSTNSFPKNPRIDMFHLEENCPLGVSFPISQARLQNDPAIDQFKGRFQLVKQRILDGLL